MYGFGPAPWCDLDGSARREHEEAMYRIQRDVERRIRERRCAEGGHAFAGVASYRCEDQVGHALDEPCTCGYCRCGAVRYDRGENVTGQPVSEGDEGSSNLSSSAPRPTPSQGL